MADDHDTIWLAVDPDPPADRWPSWKGLAVALVILGMTVGLGIWDVLVHGPIHPHV